MLMRRWLPASIVVAALVGLTIRAAIGAGGSPLVVALVGVYVAVFGFCVMWLTFKVLDRWRR
jgi:energy-converting hydrogenase Eha subunit E